MTSPPKRRRLSITDYRRNIQAFRLSLEQNPAFKILLPLARPTDPSTIPTQATITTAVQETVTLNDPYNTACSIIELAQQTPTASQTPLVSFIHALQKIELLDPETGLPQRNPDGDILWTELPTFGYTWADEWHSFQPPSSYADPLAERSRRENFETFVAQVVGGSEERYFDDLLTYAHSAMGDAFGPWFGGEGSVKGGGLGAVRVACLWFIYAGMRMEGMVKRVEGGEGREGDEGWKGGFERGEWVRWVEGLREAEVGFRNLEVRELVRRALEVIGG